MDNKIQNAKIGIFGGSFDPPHLAHVLAVLYAAETSSLDKVIVVPCFNHPFNKGISLYEHRFEMCKIAFKNLAGLAEISDLEKQNGGISYTIDTIKKLKTIYPGNKFFLIIGTDILPDAKSWKDFDKIADEAEFIILPRSISLEKRKLIPDTFPQSVREPQIILPDISATKIREQIRSGKSVEGMLSKGVYEYIIKNNLYK